VDTAQFLDALSIISAESIIIALGLESTALCLNGIRWSVFVRSSGFPHTLKTLVRIRLVAQGLNMFLPGGVIGDGLQVLFITRKSRLSGARAVTTILLDRLTAFFVILSVLGATVGNTIPGMTVGIIAMVAGGFVVVLVAGIFILLKLESRIAGIDGIFNRILMFMVNMARETGKAAKKPVILVKASLLSLMGHSTAIIVLWLLVNEFANVPFIFMVPLVSFLAFLTLVPFTFTGLGLREAALFAGLQGFGVTIEQVVAISVVWLLVSLICHATCGGLAVIMSPEPEAAGKVIQHLKQLKRPDRISGDH